MLVLVLLKAKVVEESIPSTLLILECELDSLYIARRADVEVINSDTMDTIGNNNQILSNLTINTRNHHRGGTVLDFAF